jgi:hypothetical protein
MGNIESVHRWDTEVESRRPLPSPRQDFHWLNVGFPHIFDSDYLNKKEFRTDDASVSGEGQASPPAPGEYLDDRSRVTSDRADVVEATL